ncbi:sensor domain-containing diguanylate cyclase [Litchfieldia alkalitelluris]|uniref:sensor domain-containing diguanylate cyclase n=1 Tax=Litchfieldia alkalitelluris TaxID=304268 RepID=UPI00099879A1|nr:sensor domain-containing diguanylate cyclase [Litchfieldia alkalitelluris]
MLLQQDEVQQLLIFKSSLYEIMTLENENDNIVEKLVEQVKIVFAIRNVSIFLYDEWKERYILSATTQPTSLKKFEITSPEEVKDSSEWKLPMEINGENIGVMLFELEDFSSISTKLIMSIVTECTKIVDRFQRLSKFLNEELRYERLFGLTAKFHSSMNIDDVLGEVIKTLQNVYPTFTYYLLLSHDNVASDNLPIKDLKYHNYESSAAVQAFVTGNIQREDFIKNRQSALYAPLKGKQGVYGVLQVIAPNHVIFPNHETNFIELLANTAGSALENAQLYQQSKRLVADLQLINDTTHRLNSNLRLTDTISFMSEQIIKYLVADEVGFISFELGKDSQVLPGSTGYFFSEEALSIIEFSQAKIKDERDTLFVGDFDHDIVEDEESTKFSSLMAVPMVHNGEVKGIAIVLHRNPYFFSFDTFKLFQSLIHHSTLAFSNSTLREELENLVITDHLTKLRSRNFLDDRIHKSMENDLQGTFILIDIDNFKNINDTHGHQVGDSVIIQVADLLKANIRDQDIGARWGGEELAIYLPKVAKQVGVVVANRLVEKVQSNTKPKVTISCGIADWKKEQKDTVQNLFHRADKALYAAKEAGKNRVIVQGMVVN